jgi:steroid 5-alpha reductase family enzyme
VEARRTLVRDRAAEDAQDVIWVRVVEAWTLAAGLQLVLWLVQQRTKNAGIVDVGWAVSFTFVVALFAWRATAPLDAWLPIAIVVVVWSLRLGGYLVARGAARAPEEGRVDLRTRCRRRRGNSSSSRRRPALTGILATAFVVPFVGAGERVRWLGVAIAATASVRRS